jgi:carbonic anhydrase
MSKRLIITCMDRRLPEKMKEYDNADTAIISNAGTNVFGLKNTIGRLTQENNFAEIRIITHDDCGAMRLVTEHLFEMKRASPNIYVHLVRQFENKVHQAIELDSVNEKIQKERIEGMIKGPKVTSEMLRLHSLGIPKEMMEQKKEGYYLIVSKPVFGGYKSLFEKMKMERYSSYVIQGYGEEILNDMEIAVSELGVMEIYFVIQNENERRSMEKYRDLVKMSVHRSEIANRREVKTFVVQ